MLPEYSSTEPGPSTVARSKNGLDVATCPTGKALSSGLMTGLIQVTEVADGVSPGAQSRAARTPALGVFSTNGDPVLCFNTSTPAKKKSLSLAIGPPTDP